MKATIRYTPYDGGRVGEPAIARVAEITHCTPWPGRPSGAWIHLTNGQRLATLTEIEELERRIDAAEASELEQLRN